VAAVLTADHVMRDVPSFRRVLSDAARAASKTDDIVTMGVAPDYPATGFGYIRVGKPLDLGTKTVFSRAMKFVEKPDEKTARRYLASRRYVWNAGMFVWRVATMKAALASGAPALAILEASVAAARSPRGVRQVLEACYPQLPRISIDYAVMERATNILVSSGAFGWDDVGTWTSADKHLATDARRNVAQGEVALLDVADSIVLSTGPRIAALGVKDVVVVATKDSVLVADKARVQDLKKLLAKLNANGS
ncbi:MAG: mannose-1-phosphate guanylyltransferase, partial [Kiritimatiellae bacterium]|nr:mannose-1-phosphate guanylyltransferase [Kiritimatiellia bacterium]